MELLKYSDNLLSLSFLSPKAFALSLDVLRHDIGINLSGLNRRMAELFFAKYANPAAADRTPLRRSAQERISRFHADRVP